MIQNENIKLKIITPFQWCGVVIINRIQFFELKKGFL